MKPGTKRRPEKLMMRVAKGSIVPADAYTAGLLRNRGYKIGEIVAATITKPRNPGFHRLAHQIGALVAANVDQFDGMQAHQVLKRLQIEGRIGCEEIGIMVPGYGYLMQFIPLSLGFESMGEEEFHDVVRQFCTYIAKTYWPSCTPEEIEDMAQAFVGEA